MQWPPLDAGGYEFLRRFKFRPQRVWGAEAALCDAAVGQVLLLGDIHNNRQVLDAALRTAGDEGCDVLVQVGYCWLQDANWCGFAPVWAGAMCCAVNAEVPVVVDGNHEVWPSLTAFPATSRHRRSAGRGSAAASGRFAVVGRPRQHLELGRAALRRSRRQRVAGSMDTQRRALALGTGKQPPARILPVWWPTPQTGWTC